MRTWRKSIGGRRRSAAASSISAATAAERLPEHVSEEGHAAIGREAVERNREGEGDAEDEEHPDQ